MFYVSHEFERNLLLIFDKIKTPSRVPCRGAHDSVNKDYQLSYVWTKKHIYFFLFWFIDWLMYLFTWMGVLRRTWEYVTFTTEAGITVRGNPAEHRGNRWSPAGCRDLPMYDRQTNRKKKETWIFGQRKTLTKSGCTLCRKHAHVQIYIKTINFEFL